MVSMGIKAIGLNADILSEAQNDGASDNLWSEVLRGQLVLLSPELLQSDSVRTHLSLDKSDSTFQERCTVLVCDEAHLVYIWGRHFRKPYAEIGRMRNRLQRKVRLLLLTATLRTGGPLQYVRNCFDLQPNQYIDIHHSNLRPEIRVTTSLLQSTLATAHHFPELRWVHGLPGVTIIFTPDRGSALRLTLYFRRLNGHYAHKVRKYDAMNDHSTYNKETMDLVKDLDAESDWLIIVATSILMVGVDMFGIKRVIILEPKDFDEEVQKEGRLLRHKIHATEIGESYVYVSYNTMQKAFALVDAPQVAEGKEVGGKRKRSKPEDAGSTAMDISMAQRLVSRCRTQEQNRQYQNPPYGQTICNCASCTRNPPVPNPPCLCSGCQPGMSERDILTTRQSTLREIATNAASRSIELGIGTLPSQDIFPEALTAATQTIIREHLTNLDMQLFMDKIANPGGLYLPGMFVSSPVISAIVDNLLQLETRHNLSICLEPFQLHKCWLEQIWLTLQEKVIPDVVGYHSRRKAEVGDQWVRKRLAKMGQAEIDKLLMEEPILDVTQIGSGMKVADLIRQLHWHEVWYGKLPKGWRGYRKASLIDLLLDVVKQFHEDGLVVENVHSTIHRCR